MITKLKTKISAYDRAYRVGTPLVTDQIFDALVDELKVLITSDEFEEFRATLFDVGGKIRHNYVIGSLRKTKAEDDSFDVWVGKRPKNPLLVAEKLDGISIVLHFIDGVLLKAVTRGDGTYGEDQTEKLKLITPTCSTFTGQLRGEILLTRTNLAILNATGKDYKNPRNAVSGIIGRKDFNPDDVKMLSVQIYQILGSTLNKVKQYIAIKDYGFDVPKLKVFNNGCTRENLVELYEKWTESSDYDIDGVVVYDLCYTDENVKLPSNTIAFKVNDQVDTTTVVGMEWTISKNGLYKPVVLIDPIELGGATIRRVTGHNWRNVFDKNITIGSTVVIEKAGDIIPKLIDITPCEDGLLSIPTVCEHCDTKLDHTDVELYCPNKNCEALGVKKVASFLRSCGVKGFTETTLEKFGIDSIETLINYEPNPRRKNETKLVLALDDFVFNKSIEELVVHLPYTNFGTTLVKNVLKAFGGSVEDILLYPDTLGWVEVEKVSQPRLDTFISQLSTWYHWVDAITADPRYEPNAEVIEDIKASTKFEGMAFCFTGKFNTMDRKDCEGLVWANSGELKSVSNKLTYLVNNDINSTSTKNAKAKKLGIPIITELEFLKLLEV